jgi:hypothetical protein
VLLGWRRREIAKQVRVPAAGYGPVRGA